MDKHTKLLEEEIRFLVTRGRGWGLWVEEGGQRQTPSSATRKHEGCDVPAVWGLQGHCCAKRAKGLREQVLSILSSSSFYFFFSLYLHEPTT